MSRLAAVVDASRRALSLKHPWRREEGHIPAAPDDVGSRVPYLASETVARPKARTAVQPSWRRYRATRKARISDGESGRP